MKSSSSCRATTDMEEEEEEEEEGSQTLPDALVEKILAMMPFPSIFKARSLSKSWLARFSSTSSLQDWVEKDLATSFQKQVGEWSSSWRTFSPILVTTEDLMGYNQASQSWSRLPLLSFLPENWFRINRSWQIEGPFLYGFAPPQTGFYDMEAVIVNNILTRSWRQLPPRPNARSTPVVCHKLVIYPPLEKYVVILFCEQNGSPDHYSTQVYDSKSDAWSSKSFIVSSDFTDGPAVAAYLNGVLYMVGVKTPQSLLAFKVEEGTLEELRLSFDDDVLGTATLNLVVCNVNWLMIVTKGLRHGHVYADTMQVFRIDLGTLRLLRLAQGPPAALNLGTMPFLPPIGHGNRIFFKVGTGRSRVLAYNVDENVWSCFPVPTSTSSSQRTYDWLESSFQPGFGPFVAV